MPSATFPPAPQGGKKSTSEENGGPAGKLNGPFGCSIWAAGRLSPRKGCAESAARTHANSLRCVVIRPCNWPIARRLKTRNSGLVRFAHSAFGRPELRVFRSFATLRASLAPPKGGCVLRTSRELSRGGPKAKLGVSQARSKRWRFAHVFGPLRGSGRLRAGLALKGK